MKPSVLISALGLLAQSCGSGAVRPATGPTMASPRHAQLTIDNQHRHRIDATLLHSATTYSVGDVDVRMLSTFRLPATFNGQPVQVLVRCLATGDVYSSHEIFWTPGDEVVLRVGSYVNLSKLTVR